MKHYFKPIQLALLFYLIMITNTCTKISNGKNNQKYKDFPNVLLISLDACRADHLSCYGYSRKTSPFIDQIATSGIRFANAFVNTHGTTTSHTTLLSSQYQEFHKVDYYNFEDQIPRNIIMIQEILKTHGFITLGVTDGGRMFRHFGFDRGFIVYDDHGGGIRQGTKKLTQLIKKYMAKEKPIFAFYHTYEIHSPYFPPKKYKKIFGEYDSHFIPSSENLLKIKNTQKDLTHTDLEFIRALYDAGIRYSDDTLKKFIAQLKKIGFLDHYLLIITADHGEEFGEHNGVLHRGLLYDELLHVPIIISGTNLHQGLVDNRLVSSVDIVPTILDYLNIEVHTPMAGQSLLIQTKRKYNTADQVYSQYSHSRYAIRTMNWKLILNLQPSISGIPNLELYDLKTDPGERHNMASQKPRMAKTLRKKILNWKKQWSLNLHQQELNVTQSQSKKLSKKQLDQLKTLGYITHRKHLQKKIKNRNPIKNFSHQIPNINLISITNNINSNIDQLQVQKDFIKISGWGYIRGEDSLKSHIYIVLKSLTETRIFDSFLQTRPDVAITHMNENLMDSGFITTIPKISLKKGNYQVGIYIEKGNLKALQFVSKYAHIN